ncbi:MAG: hypothetical protein D4R64_10550 [Porphyromonadaceae bacterium]|nr:MAG: hypothetical protein D4R64_10550 [Porphyromonadaceae bacterium]
MSETFDSEILNKIKHGDQQAIDKIFNCLKAMAHNILRQYDIKNYDLAKEIAHDVIAEIVMSKRIFTEPFNVMGYLRHITKSLICRHLRNSIPLAGREVDTENLIDMNPQLDADISKYEINDAFDICLGFMSENEVQLIEKIKSGESAENLTQQLGYKNKEVFQVRKSVVIAKFRGLLRKNGVDI